MHELRKLLVDEQPSLKPTNKYECTNDNKRTQLDNEGVGVR